MAARRTQIGLLAAVGLSACVMVNLLYLQPVPASRLPMIGLGTSVETTPMAPKTAGPRVVSAADADDTAKAIHRELETRGYSTTGGEAGRGLLLQAAILAYEYDHGLPLTAEATETVLRRIVLGAAHADAVMPGTNGTPAGPRAEEAIRTVQQSLSAIGYGPIKVDGHLGAASTRVIRDFERDHGLPETGRISAPLVAALARLAAQGRLAKGRSGL
jgi:Putative peptidoglycan binding domain